MVSDDRPRSSSCEARGGQRTHMGGSARSGFRDPARPAGGLAPLAFALSDFTR